MSNYKFTVGKYKTRDGRDAVVLADDAAGAYPLIGYVVWPDGRKQLHTWLDDGMFDNSSYERADLMPPTKLRPWRPEEVPLGAWTRLKEHPHCRQLITEVSEYCVGIGIDARGLDKILIDSEHSTDSGKTWLPCGVEE
jgi:hypothetical protein